MGAVGDAPRHGREAPVSGRARRPGLYRSRPRAAGLVLAAAAWCLASATAPARALTPPSGPSQPPEERPLAPLGPPPPAAPAPDSGPAPQAPQGQGPAPYEEIRRRPVTLSMFESDLREVLHEFSFQTGVNILVAPDVQGTVTAELEAVPLEQALETVLAPYGYVYRWLGSYYLVGVPDPRNLAFGLLSETVAIPVRYADAARVAAMLPESLRGYVRADTELRQLLVTAPPALVERVRQAVAQLDRPPAQMQVRVVVSELSRSASRELGIDEAAYLSGGAQAPSLTVSPEALSFTYGELVLKLRLLEEHREAAILADPDVRVSEGKPLKLFVGQRQFFLVRAEDTTRLERVDAGVQLELQAVTQGPEEVLLTVAPSVSQAIEEADVVPTVYTSELSTTVRLRSGQTAVVATMHVDRSLSGQIQTPGLARLPLLGWLFRRETRQESSRRLVIFVTPEVLPAPGAAQP